MGLVTIYFIMSYKIGKHGNAQVCFANSSTEQQSKAAKMWFIHTLINPACLLSDNLTMPC